MSKQNAMYALIVGAMITVGVSFYYSTKRLGDFIVFFGFCLSSIYWMYYLYIKRLKPSTHYLQGMGMMLWISWNSINYNLVWSWVATILFIIYTIGFIFTFLKHINEYEHNSGRKLADE